MNGLKMVAKSGISQYESKIENIESTARLNIRFAMLAQNKTLEQAAQAFGVTPAAISRKLNGIVKLSLADMINFSMFLDIPISTLLDNEQPSSVLAGRGMGPSSVEPPAGFGPTTC